MAPVNVLLATQDPDVVSVRLYLLQSVTHERARVAEAVDLFSLYVSFPNLSSVIIL